MAQTLGHPNYFANATVYTYILVGVSLAASLGVRWPRTVQGPTYGLQDHATALFTNAVRALCFLWHDLVISFSLPCSHFMPWVYARTVVTVSLGIP